MPDRCLQESTLGRSTAGGGDAQLDSSIDRELHLLQQELGFSLDTATLPGSAAQAAGTSRPVSAPAAPSGAAALLHEHGEASSTSAASSTIAPHASVAVQGPRGWDVLSSSDGVTSDGGAAYAPAGALLPGNDRFNAHQLAAASRLVAESTTASQASVPRPPVQGPQTKAGVKSEQQLLDAQQEVALSSQASETGASPQQDSTAGRGESAQQLLDAQRGIQLSSTASQISMSGSGLQAGAQQSLDPDPSSLLAGSGGHQWIARGLQAEQQPASGRSTTRADVGRQPASDGLPAAQRQPDVVGNDANGLDMPGSQQQPDAADEVGRGSGLAATETRQAPDARGSEAAASPLGSEALQLLYGARSGAASQSIEAESAAEPLKLGGQAVRAVQPSAGVGADSVKPSSSRAAASAPSEAVQDLQAAGKLKCSSCSLSCHYGLQAPDMCVPTHLQLQTWASR